MSARDAIYAEIDWERERQDAKWGAAVTRDVSLPVLLTVLTEEVGEVARAILHGPIDGRGDVYAELIQVAAVAVSMVEALENAPFGFDPKWAG